MADYWGVAIDEVENEEAYLNNVNQFRIALPGIFKGGKRKVGSGTRGIGSKTSFLFWAARTVHPKGIVLECWDYLARSELSKVDLN